MSANAINQPLLQEQELINLSEELRLLSQEIEQLSKGTRHPSQEVEPDIWKVKQRTLAIKQHRQALRNVLTPRTWKLPQ
jgi:hypothetical protein